MSCILSVLSVLSEALRLASFQSSPEAIYGRDGLPLDFRRLDLYLATDGTRPEKPCARIGRQRQVAKL